MKVALTGGIGCGKSTVVQYFSECVDWRTIETDEIVRELFEQEAGISAELVSLWGERVLTAEGRVDRKAVAAIVFSDEVALQSLEALLHPKVRKVWQAQLIAEPEKSWLVEIPLLFEKSLETEFDFSVCVESPADLVTQRMVHRGFSESEIERRRVRQMPLAEKIRRADFVLSNHGSRRFLKSQIQHLIAHLSNERAIRKN